MLLDAIKSVAGHGQGSQAFSVASCSALGARANLVCRRKTSDVRNFIIAPGTAHLLKTEVVHTYARTRSIRIRIQSDFLCIVKEEDVPSLAVDCPVIVLPSEEIVKVCFPVFFFSATKRDGPRVILYEYEMVFPSRLPFPYQTRGCPLIT